MQEETSLLRCPCCDGLAVLHMSKLTPSAIRVLCIDCGLATPFYSCSKLAIKKWNMRNLPQTRAIVEVCNESSEIYTYHLFNDLNEALRFSDQKDIPEDETREFLVGMDGKWVFHT